MDTTKVYQAYQLTITSELALPELIPLTGQTTTDVVIRFRQLAPIDAKTMPQAGPFCWANQQALRLNIPNVAQFEVLHGNEILIDPAPSADEDSIRVFLLGSALGALLLQRQLLVLHGNAIQIGNQCMICVGPSGVGKSTLAAGFMARGYPVLADDVVPINQEGMALPGFPRIKLWQDMAEKLAIETASLRRIRPEMNKFNYPVPRHHSPQQPLPVRWIYILQLEHEDDISIEPINGIHMFIPLKKNCYRPRFINGMELHAEHLTAIGKLAGQIRLARLSRPKRGFTLDAMIDAILSDIGQQP